MSSACVCHLDEWCFYCEKYVPLAKERDELIRLVDKLQGEQPKLATGLKPLSKRQAQIFDYIVTSVEKNGYPPSVREIAVATGLASSSTVQSHLERLEKKGYIKRNAESGRPRSLQITGKREVAANEVRGNRSSN